MSKRLQVILADEELEEIQKTAQSQRMTVAEWVRQTLRVAYGKNSSSDASCKLEVVHCAARNAFPTGDIDQMLKEIEQARHNSAE